MNETLIKNWNAKVGVEDEVYHLGDVILSRDYDVIRRLNGVKHLIVGNHDIENLHFKSFRELWVSINNYYEITIGETKAVLSHYPFERWNKMSYGSLHFHGHCHGTLKNEIPNRFDVGIDCHHNLEPFDIDEIKQTKFYREWSKKVNEIPYIE